MRILISIAILLAFFPSVWMLSALYYNPDLSPTEQTALTAGAVVSTIIWISLRVYLFFLPRRH